MDFKVKKDSMVEPAEKNLPACITTELQVARADALKSLDKLREAAEAVDFRAPGASQLATDLIGRLRSASNAVEKARKIAKDPHLQAGREIDDFANAVGKAAKVIIDDLSARQKKHILAQQQLAIRMAEREAEVQKAAAKVADAIGIAVPKTDTTVTAAERIIPTMAGVKTDGGSMGVKQVWKFKILDPDLVPARFKIVDTNLVQRNIDAGVREIPGIEIYQDIDLKYRASRS